MTTYKNYDVLTERPDRAGAVQATASRGLSIIASTVGKRRVLDRWGVPRVVRSFNWLALNKEGIAALRKFIADSKGRVVPCWVATDNADLVLAADAQNTGNELMVKAVGYTAGVFPTGNGRRHIALRLPSGAWLYAKVMSCTDNRDGTERLVLDATLPERAPAGSPVSFLTLCRLNEDAVRIKYETPAVAEATLNFIELPKETP